MGLEGWHLPSSSLCSLYGLIRFMAISVPCRTTECWSSKRTLCHLIFSFYSWWNWIQKTEMTCPKVTQLETVLELEPECAFSSTSLVYAAAAAKSLQLYPTLCDPRDGSPPGSPVPGILQARTLEWVSISFSNAWKWKVKVKLLSRVWLLATSWTAAHQAPPSMGFSRQEYWSGVPLPSPSLVYSIVLFQSSSFGNALPEFSTQPYHFLSGLGK